MFPYVSRPEPAVLRPQNAIKRPQGGPDRELVDDVVPEDRAGHALVRVARAALDDQHVRRHRDGLQRLAVLERARKVLG